MTIKYTTLISFVLLLFIACKPKAASDTVAETSTATTDSIDAKSYRILTSSPEPDGKLLLEVELTRKEDSTGLRYLAVILQQQKQDSLAAINFLLPWGNRGFPYATVKFSPEPILTIKPEQDVNAAIADVKGNILHVWQTEESVLGATFVLYEDAAKKLRMRTHFEDGNTMDNPIKESKHEGKVRYDDDLGQGEFYLVEASGNLGLYDATGKFDEAKLKK